MLAGAIWLLIRNGAPWALHVQLAREQHVLQLPKPVSEADFHDDGKLVASCDANRVGEADPLTGKLIQLRDRELADSPAYQAAKPFVERVYSYSPGLSLGNGNI